MSFQQHPGDHFATYTKQLFSRSRHSGAGKINVFSDVVQRDMGVKARGSQESRRRQTQKCCEWFFRRSKAGEDKIEPHYIGLQLANRLQEAHGSCHAAKLPAADDAKPRQLLLLLAV